MTVKYCFIAIVVLMSLDALSAREYHVAKTGNELHEGIYRERINPPRGGSSGDKRIVYQAAKDEKVVIKGSELVTGWENIKDDVWLLTLPNGFFGGFNPYSDVIGGEWYTTPKDGYDRHTGSVYLNEHWLAEAQDLESLFNHKDGEALYWFARVDEENTSIWAQFGNKDPNQEQVEVNVRQSIFYPDKPGRNYITVRGFTMSQAATPWSGAMSEQIGLIGTHWSKGWIIEDNVISHSMNTGITLGRYELNGVALPPETAPGFVNSIELALENGWSRENIGSHMVRNNHISHCEKNGIHGSLGGIFSTIEGNTICDIAMNGWISGPDVAGVKLLASIDVVIKNNHIYRCGEVAGLWLDWMAQGTRVSGNLFHDNKRDLFVEVNHGPFLVDNNVFLSPMGVLESSGGGAYVHNLFACQIILRTEMDRETPFHKAHSTEILGLSRVVGDDERFYNNLFIGHQGLSVYDAWEAVNLKASGNVYLAGAKPASNENNTLVLTNIDPLIRLMEKSDGWWLDLDIDVNSLADHKRKIVTTGLLGNAIISKAPFLQGEGLPYTLDTDYFGEKRNAGNPMAGPFKMEDKKRVSLGVWKRN